MLSHFQKATLNQGILQGQQVRSSIEIEKKLPFHSFEFNQRYCQIIDRLLLDMHQPRNIRCRCLYTYKSLITSIYTKKREKKEVLEYSTRFENPATSCSPAKKFTTLRQQRRPGVRTTFTARRDRDPDLRLRIGSGG